MRAAWYEQRGPARDVLVVGGMPQPAPGEGEVRIRLAFSGINPGDVKKRSGWQGSPMPYPRVVPHSDGAGVIDAVMQNVLATTKSVQPVVPAAPLYLLIASLSDIQSNESLQKEYSLWLVLAPNTGRITIASNVIQNGTAEVDVINARAKARQSIAVK